MHLGLVGHKRVGGARDADKHHVAPVPGRQRVVAQHLTVAGAGAGRFQELDAVVGGGELLVDRDAELLGQVVQGLIGRHAVGGSAQLADVEHQVAAGAEVGEGYGRVVGLAHLVPAGGHLVPQLVLRALHGFVVNDGRGLGEQAQGPQEGKQQKQIFHEGKQKSGNKKAKWKTGPGGYLPPSGAMLSSTRCSTGAWVLKAAGVA